MASATDSSVGGREMICRHMESHYRRVSAVKGRVDSSAPEALLKSVRARDRRRKEAVVKNYKFTKAKTLKPEPQSPTLVLHTPNLSQQEAVLESPRWEAYHTKTGRTAAQYEELRRDREGRDVDPSWVQHPSPWKPAVILQPLFKPDSPNGCSTPRISPPAKRKSPIASPCSPAASRASPRLLTGDNETPDKRVQFNDITLFKDSIHLTHTINLPSGSTERHLLPDCAMNSENDCTAPPIMTANQEITFHKTDTESSVVPHYRFHVAEKNLERKTKLGESVLEFEYLKFLSAITRDILTKRQFSDAGIEVLIRSHIAANRHTLREDIMWQRIAVLRRDLGLTTVINYS